ncbi:hypothetical protein B0H14DRAFT_3872914 [Mycena olivaceomarginata]|nr:hypothetical protein B0H14DRAFT_3872914 [Mycena olivaceomarginata]
MDHTSSLASYLVFAPAHCTADPVPRPLRGWRANDLRDLDLKKEGQGQDRPGRQDRPCFEDELSAAEFHAPLTDVFRLLPPHRDAGVPSSMTKSPVARCREVEGCTHTFRL